MSAAMQAPLFGEAQPSSTTDPNKTLIPCSRLLAFADECEKAGQGWKARAIRTGTLGYWKDDLVPVSNSLVRAWGLES